MCNVNRYKRNDGCEDEDDASANARNKKKKKKSDGVSGTDKQDTSPNGEKKRRVPALVMWYLLVIQRLKRFYSNPREAELMC
uniref:Uncharacterized protein n=1 Tax=Arundo donax TaxID=35708 RepID=A0A0A9BUU7_ARUDO